jgi:hypothetical protein
LKVESSLNEFRSREATLTADIASLSSKRDCDRRDIDQLFCEIERICSRMKLIEDEQIFCGTKSAQIVQDVESLKFSLSTLTPPRTVGGFKHDETIHVAVPGCSPLSEGIISHLTKLVGGNVCDRQRVHAFSDSVYNSSYLPRNAADLLTDSAFFSNGNANQTFGYDFKDNQLISPTHYTIRTCPCWGVGDDDLKSWVIEVTNDRSIDRRQIRGLKSIVERTIKI